MNIDEVNIYPLILLLISSLYSFSVLAEDADLDQPKTETSRNSLLAESEALLSKINKFIQQSEALKKKFAKASTVDHLLFFNLLTDSRKEMHSELERLIIIRQQLDETDSNSHTLLKELQSILLAQADSLQNEIKSLKGIVTKLRQQDSKENTTKFAIQRANKEMYGLLSLWQENIARQKALNMEVKQNTEQLGQTVQFIAIAQTGRIRLMLDTIKELKILLQDASKEEQKNIGKLLRKLQWRKDIEAKGLEEMVGIMNKLDMNTTKFGQALVLATGEILNENVDTKVVVGLFQMLLNNSMQWLQDNLPLIIFRLISFLLIIFAFRIIAALARKLADRATTSAQFESSQLLQNFLGSITHKAVMLVGLIIALSQLGIEIGPLLAGMGIMGFVVGFALQDALSNFASGLMILFYRPFDIGDFVDVAGINGEVKQMNLVSTTILTFDRKRMIIPNSKIWGDIITNVTAENIRRVDFVFHISYEDNIDTAEAVLQKIVQQHELVLDTPAATIKLHTLGESSLEFIVRPWVERQNYWAVYWAITRQVKEAFDKAGISIPYPQRDVHFIKGDEKRDFQQ